MTSALFRHIAELHGDTPWGDFLDAGTGVNSAQWSTCLPVQSWTGVSASAAHLAQVRDSLPKSAGRPFRLALGNWTDPDLLGGETFDTVLADYLLGAVEGFAPYFQSRLFHRIGPLVRGKLYVVGVEPYVVGPVATEADRLVREIGRLRDSVLLLADETPYREYPAEWARDAIKSAGLQVHSVKRFSNRYHARWVSGQLDMALRRLPKLPESMRGAVSDRAAALRDQALAFCEREGRLVSGSDYVIAASPRPE